MSKAKNILLIIGLGCNIIWAVLAILLNAEGHLIGSNFATTVLWAAVIFLLVSALPTILLVLNLQNKRSKASAIITVTLNVLFLAYISFDFLTPSMPQYLVYNSLGLIDIYIAQLVAFFNSGAIFLFLGSVCFIVGSILSVVKKR